MTKNYKRILLKVSGELLAHREDAQNPLYDLALSLKKIHKENIEIAIVIGGGNIFRGRDAKALGMERSSADQAGLLATMINGIFLKQALENNQVPSAILSSVHIPQMFDTYNAKAAKQALEEKKVVIFVAGLGNAYFSTDSAAVVRALEIDAEVLFKATNVDGVFTNDPKKDEHAIKMPKVSCSQILKEQLQCMDMTAAALARAHKLPIIVFDLFQTDSLEKAVEGKKIGTYVEGE